MLYRISCLICILVVLAVQPAPAQENIGLLDTARGFLKALYVDRSEAALTPWICTASDSAALLAYAASATFDNLDQDLKDLATASAPFFFFQGRPISNDTVLPVDTIALVTLQFRGEPLMLPMARTENGWRVDARFLVVNSEMQKSTDPEVAAKAFLAYLFARNDKALRQLITSQTDADMALLMRANDFPGGDLDQLLSLAMEMPVVRARDGEVFRMPSGELKTAGPSEDDVIVVGLYGMVVLPFELQRQDGKWRVVPQPYIEMMRHVGAI